MKTNVKKFIALEGMIVVALFLLGIALTVVLEVPFTVLIVLTVGYSYYWTGRLIVWGYASTLVDGRYLRLGNLKVHKAVFREIVIPILIIACGGILLCWGYAVYDFWNGLRDKIGFDVLGWPIYKKSGELANIVLISGFCIMLLGCPVYWLVRFMRWAIRTLRGKE